jgi:ABC-type uncharacterized transport system involved in gliding motility auxiliary subunit
MMEITALKKIPDYYRKLKNRAVGAVNLHEKDFQLVLNIAIIILLNFVGMTLNLRCDLTQKNNYSLSRKSRDVVSGLKENLKVRVLFSRDLPAQHAAVYRYLKDILEEYNYYGNEYFSYEMVDDKDLEKQAEDFGIRPVQSQELSSDQVRVRRVYMGLIIQQSDIIEKIDRITGTSGLEYSITTLMEKISNKVDGLLRLKNPITVSLYLDRSMTRLPIDGIGELEGKVREAVARCNSRNYDKLKFAMVDPSGKKGAGGFETYGLNKVKWGAGVSRQGARIEAGEAVFGLVLEGNGRHEVVDINVAPTIMGGYVISGADRLEDRINAAVGSLVSSNPVIGYITGHQEADINDSETRTGAGLLKKLLSDMYDLRQIDLSREDIPGDIRTIIVNGPRTEFKELELYRIDQFLMKGRSALFLLDSFAEIDMQGQQFFGGQPVVVPVNTGLDRMLEHYGIRIGKNVVLDASCAKVNLGNAIKDYPLVPIIRQSGLDQKSVITKYLKGIAFMKASAVDADRKAIGKSGADTVFLVTTSQDSWLMEGQVNFNPFMMDSGEKKDLKSRNLAVLVSGKLASYFTGRDAPKEAQTPAKNGAISLVSRLDSTIRNGRSEIIVVGTSEIARSGFLMDSQKILARGAGSGEGEDAFSNGVFIHNMADYLSGNNFAPEMQSKSLDYNPLGKTSETSRFFYKIFNIIGVPLMSVAAGIYVWRKRRSRKTAIMKEFSPEVHE